jgi:hypothetical protein
MSWGDWNRAKEQELDDRRAQEAQAFADREARRGSMPEGIFNYLEAEESKRKPEMVMVDDGSANRQFAGDEMDRQKYAAMREVPTYRNVTLEQARARMQPQVVAQPAQVGVGDFTPPVQQSQPTWSAPHISGERAVDAVAFSPGSAGEAAGNAIEDGRELGRTLIEQQGAGVEAGERAYGKRNMDTFMDNLYGDSTSQHGKNASEEFQMGNAIGTAIKKMWSK